MSSWDPAWMAARNRLATDRDALQLLSSRELQLGTLSDNAITDDRGWCYRGWRNLKTRKLP